jgi:hypothetical protein
MRSIHKLSAVKVATLKKPGYYPCGLPPRKTGAVRSGDWP